MNLLPDLYNRYAKMQIHRHYKQLARLEKRYPETDESQREELMKQLKEIDHRLRHLRLPFFQHLYQCELYDAREHIDLVRARLNDEADH